MSDPRPTERTVFLAAIEQPATDRAAYLDVACAGDDRLRAEVEELLAAHDRLGTVDSPTATADQPGREGPGTVIGPYKLLEQIGEGGFGVVFLAEQTEPVRRKVALKVLKAGMDSRQVIARFEAERQALAIMDHPNIAKVFDGGETPSGRPYFVMEQVKGVPITEFCDQNHLTPRQRLELFVPVCDAIQHAHQKGVIHRDIKPSNVLVACYDDKPVGKVIDFGVAKAAGQPLTERTLHTGFGAVVGTVEYMSPEQATFNQLDVDTRSDIYSLGVLLYELLAGSTPFTKKDLETAGMLEMLRVIREDEPSKPSTKLSTADGLPTLAANRGTEPAKLTKLVRGELDWIVMKALEKDRNRRYETANGFAMDVQRYLADEAVLACPPSVTYRLRKLVRRNKRLLVTAAVVAAALLLGIVGTTWQAIRATNALSAVESEAQRANREAGRAAAEAHRATALAEEARTEAAIAKAVNTFLNEDLLGAANPFNEPDRDIKLRTVVDRAAEKIEGRFRDQPLVEAAIRNTLGEVYVSLGDYVKAEGQHRRALELHRRHLGSEHAATAATMTLLATALWFQHRHAEHEKLHREALAIKRRVLGPDHPSTLDNLTGLANCSQAEGRYAEAEQLHREVYEVRRRVLGPEHPHTLLSEGAVGLALKRQGRNAEAEQVYREVLTIRRRLLPPEHPDILTTMTFLAAALRDQNRLAEAEELYREVYDTRKRVLGPEHPATMNSRKFLAAVVRRQGRHEDARPVFEEARRHSRQGLEQSKAGRHKDAAESFRQAIATLENLTEEFPATAEYRQHLGRCYLWLIRATADPTEKKELLDKALALWGQLAAEFPDVAWNWCDLGEVHGLLGQWHKAVDAQTRAIGLDPEFLVAWYRRGWAHANLGEWEKAVTDQSRVLELDRTYWGAHWRRGDAYRALKQWAGAAADYEQAIALGAAVPVIWVSKAAAHARLNQPDEAVAALGRAIAKGFRDARQLKTDDDFAALRGREDFKKVLTDLEAKKK